LAVQCSEKERENAKLDCPGEGPYLVISVLSDVVYLIQKSVKAKPKVIHADRLKPYLGPPGEASDVNFSVFVEEGQSVPVNGREGFELVETEVMVGGEEDDVTWRAQNADNIGVDNSDQPGDVREPEPHAELPTSGVDDHNPEDASRQAEESTVQVVPETDSSVQGRPSR